MKYLYNLLGVSLFWPIITSEHEQNSEFHEGRVLVACVLLEEEEEER